MDRDLSDFIVSTSVSSSGTQEEQSGRDKKKTRKSSKRKLPELKWANSSSCDADVSAVDNERRIGFDKTKCYDKGSKYKMAGLITKLRDLSSGSSSNKKTKNKKYDSDSIYSMVSCSDLTPGSLEIWVDLPNEIKYDASLAPFKQLYEHHHGKSESETPSEGDKSIFVKKTTELETIGEVDSSEPRTREYPSTPGDRLIDGPANEEKKQESARKKRISRLLHIGKMAFLIACWLLLTTALLLNRETSDVVLHTAVQAGIVKEYALEPSSGQVKVLIKLTGPFQQNDDLETNSSEHGMLRIWLQRSRSSSLRDESSTYWEIPLQPDSVIDFSRSEVVSKILKLQSDGKFASTRRAELQNDTVSKETNDRVIKNDTEYQSRRDVDQESLKYHHNEIQEIQGALNAAVQREEDIERRNSNNESQDAIDLDETQNERRDYSVKGVLGVRSGDVVGKPKYYDWNRDGNTSVTTSASNHSQKVEVVSNERREINTLKGSNRFELPDTVRIKRESSVKGHESKGNLILSVTIKDKSDDVDFKNSSKNITEKETLNLLMDTTSNATVPVTLTYEVNPLEEDGVVYAAILLCFLYVLIIFEIVNRTVAALLSSSLGIAVLALAGSRPSLGELVSWLDVETLLLLFSMMLLVAILAETGLFDYLAVVAFEVTGGRTWPLINCLCLFTAVFSTFLDNVTTVLLMTPVTIRLCEVMQLNPIPVLMSMVVFSNVGGAATPVGDPPNVIIANHPAVLAQGINFVTFTVHMTLGILLVSVQTYLQLRFMFRDIRKLRHNVPHDIQELRQEIAVWRRAAASLSSYSRDEDLVRKALEKKVERLQKALARREAGGGSKTDPKFCSTLAQMKQKYRIRDKMLLIKSTICTTFVVVVFFLHCIPELQRLSLGWTALLGALLLLLLADHDDLEPILARVEWSTLLFFAALFVLMEALSKLGLITWIGNITEMIIRSVSEESKLAVALMLVLWVSGIASAFVDNIPLTTMMVRVVAALAAPDGLALPLAPLAWALSFGACLGGNGTLIGASANVVCAGVAEQHGYRFTFMQFFRVGFPLMLGHLIVASIYLLICHCAFTWH